MPPIQNNMQGLPQIVVSPVQSKNFYIIFFISYSKSSQFTILTNLRFHIYSLKISNFRTFLKILLSIHGIS